MKKILTLFILFSNISYGQYNLADNKSYFENLNDIEYSIINYSDQNSIGDRASWVMMSYLNMYETTGDKAYLVKFINVSIQCLLERLDVKNSNFGSFAPFPPKWTLESEDDGQEKTYYNTLLLFPMAKFIYLVRNNTELYNSNLSESITKLNLVNDNFPTVTILGYGDYANWLGQRVEETMWYLNAYYWDDDNGHIQFQDGTVAALNFQSLFATMYLYMYKVNTTFGPWALSNSYIKAKIEKLRDLFLGDFQDCDIPNQPVFTPQSNNSFKWGHYGWQYHEFCSFPFLKEDLAHGAMDLFFPMADWNLGTNLFSTTNFHNWAHETFTQNIYVFSDRFYNTVFGDDIGFTSEGLSTDCFGNLYNVQGDENVYWGEVLAWMPLEVFDSPTSVYEMLIYHTDQLRKDEFHNFTMDPCRSTYALSGPLSFVGLSEVTKAQWKRECVDLNMTNRDLIYNQDFFAKGNIYIQPTITSTSVIKAFAEPNNTTTSSNPDYFNKNEYVVESGVKSHMVAGNGIHLYPGFSAKAGCDFRAYIDPSLCDGGETIPFHSLEYTSSSTAPTIPSSFSNPIIPKPLVNLQATVDIDKQLVYLQSENTNDKNQNLVVTDVTGRIIRTFNSLPSYIITNEMPTGCYIFCYTTINGRASQKVFIN